MKPTRNSQAGVHPPQLIEETRFSLKAVAEGTRISSISYSISAILPDTHLEKLNNIRATRFRTTHLGSYAFLGLGRFGCRRRSPSLRPARTGHRSPSSSWTGEWPESSIFSVKEKYAPSGRAQPPAGATGPIGQASAQPGPAHAPMSRPLRQSQRPAMRQPRLPRCWES